MIKSKTQDSMFDKIIKIANDLGYKTIVYGKSRIGIFRQEDDLTEIDRTILVQLTNTGRLTILVGLGKKSIDLLQEFVTDQMLEFWIRKLTKKVLE